MNVDDDAGNVRSTGGVAYNGRNGDGGGGGGSRFGGDAQETATEGGVFTPNGPTNQQHRGSGGVFTNQQQRGSVYCSSTGRSAERKLHWAEVFKEVGPRCLRKLLLYSSTLDSSVCHRPPWPVNLITGVRLWA